MRPASSAVLPVSRSGEQEGERHGLGVIPAGVATAGSEVQQFVRVLVDQQAEFPGGLSCPGCECTRGPNSRIVSLKSWIVLARMCEALEVSGYV
jgi:hypothetical protein